MMLQTFQNILLYTKTSSKWYYWAKKDSKSISSGGDRLNWIKNDLVPANTKHFRPPRFINKTKAAHEHSWLLKIEELPPFLCYHEIYPRLCFHPSPQVSFQKATPFLHSVSPICSLCGTVSPIKQSISIHFCWQDSYPTNGPWCHPGVVVGLGYVGGQWQGQIHVITGLALLPCGKWSSCKSLGHKSELGHDHHWMI